MRKKSTPRAVRGAEDGKGVTNGGLRREIDDAPPEWRLLLWQVLTFPLVGMPASVALAAYLLECSRWTRAMMAVYFVYIAMDKSPAQGGSELMWRWGVVDWLRSGVWWRRCVQFYPSQLIKTHDLPPGRPYLFACHPHGVLGVGVAGHFTTNGTGFNRLFPDIRVQLAGLKALFYLPFYREWVKAHGSVDPSASSLQAVLDKGHSIAISVGGAREALEAHPRTSRLVLGRRRGFIRCAVHSGASLVPVISFGENDLFWQCPNAPGSLLRHAQETLRGWFTFSLPVVVGYSWWLPIVPRRRPITTVVGAPIRTDRTVKPSQEYIDKLHANYVQALRQLYADHCAKYGYADVPLEIID